jgi:hypothetical protein
MAAQSEAHDRGLQGQSRATGFPPDGARQANASLPFPGCGFQLTTPGAKVRFTSGGKSPAAPAELAAPPKEQRDGK